MGRFGGGIGAPGRLNRGPDAGCVGAGVGNEGGGGGDDFTGRGQAESEVQFGSSIT